MKPWMSISPDSLDPSQKDHEAELGYGRLVMLFKCWFNVKQGSPNVQQDLAFIEEFWPYKNPSGVDTLCEDFGCTRLYSTSPQKVYYVIDISLILGPAPITRDPVNPTIPHGAFKGFSALRKQTEYQDARADTRKGSGDGSPLYIVNKWAFRWGL
jgi:hypothetical protein